MWTGNLAILFLLLPLVEPASLHIDDSSSEWMFLNTSSSWNSTLDSSSAHSTSIGDSQGYLHFCGSSVSVYGIIQPPPAKGKSGQNVTFWFADNEQQPTSVFNPSPSPQNITEYDVLLYEQTGLNEDVYRTLWFRMGSTTKSLTYLNYAIVNSTDGVK
ncbi:hypothetical protein DL96DRAFT_1713599 [Flagelloscypha sp. PMI_526]|nr:hypothetical protein DL96DRAFT_1713599 [Flagelloscypha sp. PMI_526]